MQLPIGTLVGCFITFCCNLASSLPSPESVTAQFVLMIISTVVIAVGVFMYVPTGLIALAPEGTMLAVAKITKSKFSNVKLIFDISMVGLSCIVCMICIGELGSVGVGSVIAAILVGNYSAS